MLIAELTSQRTCPFGDAALQFNDTVLAAETCEELFTPMAPHIRLALSGAPRTLSIVSWVKFCVRVLDAEAQVFAAVYCNIP